jgi:hypothetical protein
MMLQASVFAAQRRPNEMTTNPAETAQEKREKTVVRA